MRELFDVNVLYFLVMYLGFVLIGHGRVTDTETTAFGRRIYYLQFPRKGVCQAFRATWGSSRVGSSREGGMGKHGLEPLLWSPRERRSRAKQFRIG